MDVPAFASLAQVRILLLPIGNISRETFNKWAAQIRTFEDVRLGDIPSDGRDERARFMPSPLSRGHLHISFPSHPPPTSHDPLALFRPSHFPLGVIGVASCSQSDSLSSILAQFNAFVNDLFPRNSPYRAIFPLAKNCFVFEEEDGSTNLNLGEQLSGLVVIPSMMGNKGLYIGTLLADLCSNILGEFATLAQSLESPVGNEYLNASLFPVAPSSGDLPISLNNDIHARNSLPPMLSSQSQPNIPTLSGMRHSAPLTRTSSTGPGVTSPTRNSFRQSSLVPPPTQKRKSGIGAASSHGRLFKVLGDLFLLAGRTEDAVVWYNEAIVLFKSPQDVIWHASALEGLAVVTVVDAWSSGHGLNSSFSGQRGPWVDVADKLIQASALYQKGPLAADGGEQYSLTAFLYTSVVLRNASLLFATWSAKGWGPLAFATMLQPGPSPVLPPTLSNPDGISVVGLERLSSLSGITRSQIAEVIADAHGPWLLHLGQSERIMTLETMAGLYSSLGYKRKESYILREILGCIMDLIVVGRDDPIVQSPMPIASPGVGLGIQGVITNGISTVGIRVNERTEGNESIIRLVRYICRVHGINMEAVPLGDPETVRVADKESDEVSSLPPQQFGWPELQIGIVREALAVAEALPDYPTVAQFALSALKELHPVLPAADQQHLYSTSGRALATARRRGDKRSVEYWSGHPVVSIEVTPLPFVRLPVEKPISTLSTRSSNPILPRATDPFLYNPRRAMTAQGQMTVVQNESVEVIVTIKNPFVFDLEIQSITLSTSGVEFEHKPAAILVPPNSFYPVVITGRAMEPGVLTIKGCIVQAPDGAPREFILPLSTGEEDERESRRRSAFRSESERFKYGGLESLPWEKSRKRSSTVGVPERTSARMPRRFLECKVVPEQPLLRVRRTSLTHGALMLYDGETSTIRATLENVSSIPIDHIRLSFDDNTIAPAQQALSDGDLSVFETYETEYELIHRPVFSWPVQEDKEVAPGSKTVMTITCYGKVGCTSGSIQVSYSYVRRRKDTLEQPLETFHTRHLTYPVLVTVYHMLECHGMDIIPWSGFIEPGDDMNEDSANPARRLLLESRGGPDWVIFAIDVRNMYGSPFDVTFTRNQPDVPTISSTCIVAPGSSTRILVPFKKFLLPEDHVSKPIPTLSERQFIVDKTKMSTSEVQMQRELFWYREELFKHITGRWQEVGGTRSGELSLRQQRLTLPMLETMRTEKVRVQLAINHIDEAEVEPLSRIHDTYTMPMSEFHQLTAKVTNLSRSRMVITVDLTAEPYEHVIYEGSLTNIAVGALEPGMSAKITVPICFVSCGRFEINADARIWGIMGEDSKVGSGKLRADVRDI